MPRVKTAKAFRTAWNVKAIGAFVLLAFLVSGIYFVLPPGASRGSIAFFIFVFFVLCAVPFRKRIKSIVWPPLDCPDCNARIHQPLENSGEEGEPVLYLCKHCDVLWFAGHTASSSA